MFLTGYDEEAYKRACHNEGRRQMAEEGAINLLIMGILTPEQIAQAEGLPLERVLEFEKNVQEGLQQGTQIGRQQMAEEAAVNLLRMKLGTPEQIAQAEGLSLEKVLELQKSIQAKA